MDTHKNETFTVGFTTNKALMLDLDRFTYAEALDLAVKTTNKFQLEGFLIAKSSELNYHVVFNKFQNWDDVLEELFKIVWSYHYYGHGEKPHLTNWAILQVIKQSITLRIGLKVSEKGNKSRPKVILVRGKTHQNIHEYLHMCKVMFPICKKVKVEVVEVYAGKRLKKAGIKFYKRR